MTPINKFYRNQLIAKIVKKIEKAFNEETSEICDRYGGSMDYGEYCRIEGFMEMAITAVESFKEERGL